METGRNQSKTDKESRKQREQERQMNQIDIWKKEGNLIVKEGPELSSFCTNLSLY